MKEKTKLKFVGVSVRDAFPKADWAKEARFEGYKAVIPIAGDWQSPQCVAIRRGNLRRILEDAAPEMLPKLKNIRLSSIIMVRLNDVETTYWRRGGACNIKSKRVVLGESVYWIKIADICKYGPKVALCRNIEAMKRQIELDLYAKDKAEAQAKENAEFWDALIEQDAMEFEEV